MASTCSNLNLPYSILVYNLNLVLLRVDNQSLRDLVNTPLQSGEAFLYRRLRVVVAERQESEWPFSSPPSMDSYSPVKQTERKVRAVAVRRKRHL